MDITITAYKNTVPTPPQPQIAEITVGESTSKSFQDSQPRSGYNFGVFLGGDSLIINYGNQRKEIFNQFNNVRERNLLLIGGTDDTYIFTQEDFENAELVAKIKKGLSILERPFFR